MEFRTMYCPKCKHGVNITLTQGPLHGGHANVDEGAEVVCLDFGPHCSDALCAVVGVPRVVMGVRLSRSGLRPDQFETVRGVCDGCHRVLPLRVIDDHHAHCPDCGTVNTWTMIRLDGDEWVAVTGARAEADVR